MVDTVKCLPIMSIVSASPRRFDQRTSKTITLPIFFSINESSRASLTNNHRHWIGRCPGDPHRSLKIATGANRLYRRSTTNDVSRYHSLNVDMSPAIRIKAHQRQKTHEKDPTKLSDSGATVTSMSIVSDVDSSQSRLSCISSKNVLNRIDRLRSIKSSVNSLNVSTGRKKRNDANQSETSYYRSTPGLDSTHVIVLHHSIIGENTNEIEALSRLSNSSSVNKTLLPTIPVLKDENYLTYPQLLSSFTSMNRTKSIDEHSNASTRGDLLFLQDDLDGSNPLNTIAPKVYKLPLPSQTVRHKQSLTKKETSTKTIEKKSLLEPVFFERNEIKPIGAAPPLVTHSSSMGAKSKRQTFTVINVNDRYREEQQLATTSTPLISILTSSSKFEHHKWDEPYTGARVDPPTPPCSPSLLLCPEDSYEYETCIDFERSPINDVYF